MSKRSHRDSVSDTDVDIAGNDSQSARIVVVPREDDTTPRKLVDVDSREDDAPEVMRCTLPPHRTPIVFSSYEDYEVHYAQSHVNRCLQCRRNFPTAHYLTLHIEENHDPLADSKRDRGEKTTREAVLWARVGLADVV
ncbi:hypothetical protein KEM56_005553 [Ascosphaera pollenicola]|nr:hypothetical protein KEM56_005553 [Ascosphaera pollenicola]